MLNGPAYSNSADDVIDALLYPRAAVQNVEFMRNQFRGVEQMLDPHQREFRLAALAAFEQSQSDAAMQRNAEIIRQYYGTGLASQSVIVPLGTADELSMATPYMQNWLMACPEVSELYHKQVIDGYSGTYVDPCPGLTGWHNPYYRAATDGLIVKDNGVALIHQYFDDDGLKLRLYEQESIVQSWRAMIDLLEAGEVDPSSPFGDSLK